MNFRARSIAMALLFAIWAAAPGPAHAAGEARPLVCLLPGETREALLVQKLIAPFRAMIEAARAAGGESIAIKLCRMNAQMVYDVMILRRDGRVVHVLVDANTAGVLPNQPIR